MVIVMVVMVMVMVAGPGATIEEEQRLHYIKSSTESFFVAPGLTISPVAADWILAAKNTCLCRRMCMARVSCVAWSAVVLDDDDDDDLSSVAFDDDDDLSSVAFDDDDDDDVECRLARTGPTAYDVLHHPNGTYYFKEAFNTTGLSSANTIGPAQLTPLAPRFQLFHHWPLLQATPLALGYS
ncbi:uncharacterized protein LOC121854736 [Homarus americanus]|uniref:uncharacterized protein LOC121854736 n=1 Tax=Homarus americanus TaxID=6706 RepID=UPI001C465CA9|nr:uncharacterized protein LOC121854736 [Homarus americanus]